MPPAEVDKLDKEQARRIRQRSGPHGDGTAAVRLLPRGRRARGRRNARGKGDHQGRASSEYFIYTIEGTETIRNGWSKRMRSLERPDVPFKIQYRYRPQEYGDQLVRMYLLTNDKDSKLGTTPLPDGVVRVFRENGRDGLILSDRADDQVRAHRRQDRTESRRRSRGDLRADQAQGASRRHLDASQRRQRLPPLDEPGLQIEQNSSVAGWDDHEVYTQRVRNYTAKPIDLEIRRSFDGHVTFRSQLEPKLHDYQTVEFGNGRRRQTGRLALRNHPPPGPQRDQKQRDPGSRRGQVRAGSREQGAGSEGPRAERIVRRGSPDPDPSGGLPHRQPSLHRCSCPLLASRCLRQSGGLRQPARTPLLPAPRSNLLLPGGPILLTLKLPADLSRPLPMVAIAQLVRAPDCGSGGRGFKSH